MIEYLVHLPYIDYWLPALAAVAAGGTLWWLVRPGRAAVVAPAGDGPLGPEVVESSTEQRRSFRRGGNTIDLLFIRPGQNHSPLHASLLDRSMGGICLTTSEPFPVGTLLSVRPAHSAQIVPWVEVEVIACRPGEESFEVGCRFVKTPPYSILLLFG